MYLASRLDLGVSLKYWVRECILIQEHRKRVGSKDGLKKSMLFVFGLYVAVFVAITDSGAT